MFCFIDIKTLKTLSNNSNKNKIIKNLNDLALYGEEGYQLFMFSRTIRGTHSTNTVYGSHVFKLNVIIDLLSLHY